MMSRLLLCLVFASLHTLSSTVDIQENFPIFDTAHRRTSLTRQHQNPCVCDQGHSNFKIYECPDHSSKVLGRLTPDSSHGSHCAKLATFVISPSGWFSVVHAGKVGYISFDAGLGLNMCPGQISPYSGIQPKPCQNFKQSVPQTTTRDSKTSQLKLSTRMHQTTRQNPSTTLKTTTRPQKLTTTWAEYPCVCDVAHTQLNIYECSDVSSPVVGFLYPQNTYTKERYMDKSDFHCAELANFVQSPNGWLPVVHRGKVGFIRSDSGAKLFMCPVQIHDHSGIKAKACQTFISYSSTHSTTFSHHNKRTTTQKSMHTTIPQQQFHTISRQHNPNTATIAQHNVPTTPQQQFHTISRQHNPNAATTTQHNVPTTPARHPCVCDISHPQLNIYQCSDVSSPIVGFLYLQTLQTDKSSSHCAELAYFVVSPSGWFPVLHHGKVGYIRHDSGVQISLCPGHFSDHSGIKRKMCQTFIQTSLTTNNTTSLVTRTQSTSLSTKSTTLKSTKHQTTAQATNLSTKSTTLKSTKHQTTTQATNLSTKSTMLKSTKHQTTKLIQPSVRTTTQHVVHRCDIRSLLWDLSKHESISHPGSRRCPNGDYNNEAIVMKHCGTPEHSKWTKGIKVLDNCSNIPPYTPVNMYGYGQDLQVTGVFWKCAGPDTLLIIHQDCTHGVHLETIDKDKGSHFFHVLDWK